MEFIKSIFDESEASLKAGLPPAKTSKKEKNRYPLGFSIIVVGLFILLVLYYTFRILFTLYR